MMINDLYSNVTPMLFAAYASRTQNGSYANLPIKNMRRKELGVLLQVHISTIVTNLLLKLQTGDVSGTLTDITEASLAAVAIPGAGEFGAKGTVATAAGIVTITTVGTYVLWVPGKFYKQFLAIAHQTTGGACGFSIQALAVGPNVPMLS